MSEKDEQRYLEAVHAVQTGVKFFQERDGDGPLSPTGPKHLRVGVNVTKCDNAALALLLIEKGVFTLDEYHKSIADEMEEEVKRYEERANREFGQLGIIEFK